VNVFDTTSGQSLSYRVANTVTSLTLPTPLVAGGGKVVWNVRLVNGTVTGPPSVYLYFQTPAVISLPAPVVATPGSTTSPGPVLTTTAPTFTWHAVTGVTFSTYQLNLEDLTASKFASYQIANTATNFTLPTALTAGDKYVWNLRLVDGSVSGPPSTYLYFQAPPAVVALPAPEVIGPGSTTSPGPVLTTASPTFTWHAVTGVTFTAYQLNLEDLTASKFVSYQISPTATSFVLPTTLTAGDKYVWNLRLVNGNVSGPPSAYLYFQASPPVVALPAPVVVGPGGTTSPGPLLTTASPTFTWQAVTGITFTAYQINLEDLTASKFVSYQIAPTATSFALPTPLTAGDKYVWNLRLVNGTLSGPPSAYLYFQAPAAAVLPAPVVTAPGSTASPGPVLTTFDPTFAWHAVTGVTFTAYQLNLEDLTASKFVSYQIAPTATSFTPTTPLTAGDKYVWNLRLDNGTLSGPPSTYLYFQAPPISSLPKPVVVGPGTTTSPGPLVTSTTPTFTWKAVTGVSFATYQLNLYDITKAKFLTFQIAATATSFTVPAGDVAAGDAFVWNLRLNTGTATGPESAYLYFET
jgi:hypothetical protein